MIDPYVLLTPILLLGVIALLRFVGCDLVFKLTKILSPPANLRAVAGIDAKVTLSWDPSPDAGTYKVYRDGGSPQDPIPVTTTGHVDTSVMIGITYSYTVTTVDSDGEESGPSNAALATPGPISFQQFKESPENIIVNSVPTDAFPNVTQGNLMVVWIYYDNSNSIPPNASVSSVTDSAGDQYLPAVPPTQGTGTLAGYQQEIWYKNNITGGPNLTVTANFTGSLNGVGAISAHEYSGADRTEPLDVVAPSASGSGMNASSGSVLATAAKLIFGAAVFDASGMPGGGFTQRSSLNGNVTEDKPFPAPGMAEATFTTTTSLSWIAQMAAFK